MFGQRWAHAVECVSFELEKVGWRLKHGGSTPYRAESRTEPLRSHDRYMNHAMPDTGRYGILIHKWKNVVDFCPTKLTYIFAMKSSERIT